MLSKPRLLGINEPVVWSAKEVQIYKHQSIELLTDIDLLYFTSNRAIVAEYKTSPGHFGDAVRQLALAEEFVRTQFRVRPIKLYVTGPKFSYHWVP